MNVLITEKEVKNVITKSNLPVCDFSVNPYLGCLHACKYCYASFMKCFSKHTEPWGEFLDIKYWDEIKNPHKYDGKTMFISSVTDPYQPLEEKYERTKTLLEQLQGANVGLSIATKSDLILRDLDLLKSFENVRVSFSINTLDENFKNDMDDAVSIKRRLKAMKTLYYEGIRTTCFISPIFPEITDVPSIINKTKDYCNLIWLENLNLRGDYKSTILNYIKENYPDLFPLYDLTYNKKDRGYWKSLNNELKEYCENQGLLYLRDDDSIIHPFDEPPIVVNYFYHEEITKTAKRRNNRHH